MMFDELDWNDSSTIFGKFHKLLLENKPREMNTDCISRLTKNETVLLIQHYYQGQTNENEKEVLKRKIEQESMDVKKLRVYNKVNDDSISALEMLPNEVYEEILKPLNSQDKKNLRTVNKRLFQKTTLMSSMFYGDWCFDAIKGTPPDFVMKSKKNFLITCTIKKLEQVIVFANIINSLNQRIVSLKIDDEVEDQGDEETEEIRILNHLKDLQPAQFPHLTSLLLSCCDLRNECLLLLAPQLETLYLNLINTKFDVTTVTSEDDCFTKLKSLTVKECEIDALRIVEKSSTTLQNLTLSYDKDLLEFFNQLDEEPGVESLINFETLGHELSSLKYLDILVSTIEEMPAIQNLLSKACRRLTNLQMKLLFDDHYDFTTLVEHDMSITSLCLYVSFRSKAKNIGKFFEKCPRIQILTCNCNCKRQIKEKTLKELKILKLKKCGMKFTSSILKLAAKTQLKTLHISDLDLSALPEYPVIHSLETVSISSRNLFLINEIDKVCEMFPGENKVNREVLLPNDQSIKIIFTRI